MSKHLCTCGTVMFYDQENDQHVCFPCANKEAVRLHEVEVARDAIVEAADAWNQAGGEWLPPDRMVVSNLIEAIDAWRKLKGKG